MNGEPFEAPGAAEESPVAGWAAIWSRLIVAAGGETLALGAGVAALDRTRPRLADANRLLIDAGEPGFEPHLPARLFAQQGVVAGTCDLLNAGELLQARLEGEQERDVERWSPLELRDGRGFARPDGLQLVPAAEDRDRMAWEQIETELATETDEPASRAADLSAWLRAAGASLWLATLSGAPAGAAALFVHGGEALAARLTERPALRRRGVEAGMISFLIEQAHSRGAGPLRLALPAAPGPGMPASGSFPGARGLQAPGEAGTILRFLVHAEER